MGPCPSCGRRREAGARRCLGEALAAWETPRRSRQNDREPRRPRSKEVGMNRRTFVKAGALAGISLAASRVVDASEDAGRAFAPRPEDGWRVFEVTSRIEVQGGAGTIRVWLPLPSLYDPAWIRPMGNLWQGDFENARVVDEPPYGTSLLAADWPAGRPSATLEVVSRFSARDRAVALGKPGEVAKLDPQARRLYTSQTRLIRTDGIVRRTALEITKGAGGDLARAKAIYEWVVEKTARNPRTRGCGVGDVRSMLETGDLSGKCADLNALYVALARAVEIPARDVYGIRVADSRFGIRCLGKSGDVTKAQHCRAEVFLSGYGWVPVDPADVRKVVLEEKPGLTLRDEPVPEVRERLFGSWETN